jgi:hypothetical protein
MITQVEDCFLVGITRHVHERPYNIATRLVGKDPCLENAKGSAEALPLWINR